MIWMLSLALSAPPTHIVGGEPSAPDAWPSVAALYSGSDYACTGVLIAPDVVLTAGHCGTRLTEVRLGLTDANSDDGEAITIDTIDVYPRHLTRYDLALLRLTEPAITPPSPLLTGCAVDYLIDGAPSEVVGFGATNRFGTVIDGVLRQASMPIVDADCGDANRGCNVAILPGGESIAGGDGVDSCNGDSGGPLFLTVGETAYVAGIVSRAALPTDSACGDGGIYTRIDPVIDWIEETADIVVSDPDCSGVPVPNQPPELVVEPVDAVVDDTLTLDLTATDPDDDPLTLDLLEPPLDGDVVIDGLVVTYTPDPDVRGSDAFTLVLSDDADPPGEAIATVTLSVDTVVEPIDPVDTSPPESPETECGCDAGAAGTSWWLLAVIMLGVRSRASAEAR